METTAPSRSTAADLDGGPAANRISLLIHLGWLWLILLAAIILRCLSLEERSLWFDETLSWRFASHSLTDIPKLLETSQHPPLYFFLLRRWMPFFGDTPVALPSLTVFPRLAA